MPLLLLHNTPYILLVCSSSIHVFAVYMSLHLPFRSSILWLHLVYLFAVPTLHVPSSYNKDQQISTYIISPASPTKHSINPALRSLYLFFTLKKGIAMEPIWTNDIIAPLPPCSFSEAPLSPRSVCKWYVRANSVHSSLWRGPPAQLAGSLVHQAVWGIAAKQQMGNMMAHRKS